MDQHEMRKMAEAYHDQLEDRSYFLDRGIDDAVIDRHLLGVVREPLTEEHAKYRSLATFPYLTASQQVVAIRAGVFESEAAGRYDLGYMEHRFPLTHPRFRVYNVGNAMPGLRTKDVHVTESVELVLKLRSQGERGIAVPGWQNFHPWWIELLQHSNVIVHHDGTKAKAVADVMEMLRRRRISFMEQAPKQKTGTVVE